MPIPTDGIIRNPDKTQSYVYIPKDYRNAYVITWNFAVQQSLPGHLNLDVAYVGSHGVDTAAAINLNPGLIRRARVRRGNPTIQQFGRTVAETQYFQGFSSSYHSLQVKFDRRWTSGLTMTTAFTWQKAMDFQSGDDGGLARWYINPERNYARADFDRTLNYVQSYVYRMPFGKGQKHVHARRGRCDPGRVAGDRDPDPADRVAVDLHRRRGRGRRQCHRQHADPDLVAPINVLHGINMGNPWFDRSSFAMTTPGTFGSMGRAVWSGPGQFRLDAGLIANGSVSMSGISCRFAPIPTT